MLDNFCGYSVFVFKRDKEQPLTDEQETMIMDAVLLSEEYERLKLLNRYNAG